MLGRLPPPAQRQSPGQWQGMQRNPHAVGEAFVSPKTQKATAKLTFAAAFAIDAVNVPRQAYSASVSTGPES